MARMGEIEEESSIKIIKDETFPKGIRVMAIDDDLFCLKLLEMQLVSCGYEVDAFQHPVSALNTLRKNKGNYDLVITDVRMPGMNGFKLSEIIDYEMDLPVVMVSADDEVNTVMEGINHKACDFISKPTRIEELKLIWKHVLKKSLQKTKRDYPNVKPQIESKSKGSSEEVNSSKQMARLCWRPEMHKKFLAAIDKLGFDKATPSKIHALMKVPELTSKQVASHLQSYRKSYRNSLKKKNESSKQCLSKVNSVGSAAKCIDSSSLPSNGQTPNFGAVGYQSHLITTVSHYQPSDSINCINDSMFLSSSTNEPNNSTIPLISQFGNPQLASNLSLVPIVQQTASHVNNNFQDCWPSSTNQSGFVSPVYGQHQQYNAKTVPNLISETAENIENNESNRISCSQLHATFLDHSQYEALFLNTSQSVEDLHAVINPISLRRQKDVISGNYI